MALGDGGNFSTNKDTNNKNYDPTVYSPIKFKNPDAVTDPSELSFSFWKNMLKVTISPKIEPRPEDKYVMYDHNPQNNISILLNPVKAKMFHDEIIAMLEDGGKTINNVGVNSGLNGLITLSNGKEFGVDGYMLVIRKLDENGATQSSYSYQFNNPEYYMTIRDFDESSRGYNKQYHERVEIDYLLVMLESFYRDQTYTTAYTIIDAEKYNFNRLNTKIELVMDKLGIPKTSGNGNGGRGNSSSFFSGQGSNNEKMANAGYTKPTNNTTLDDLAGELN